MNLLIVTQAVDRTHPLLGFFVDWLEVLRGHASVSSLHVICLAERAETLPGISLTCIGGGSRLRRLMAFWHAVATDRSDTVLIHMTPVWLVLGWPIWALRRVRMALWYTHGSTSFMLRLAVHLAQVTFTATEKAFPFHHARVRAVGLAAAEGFASVHRMPRPEERLACLAVGRIMPRKRIRETIALFAQVRRLVPEATLTIVGPRRDLRQGDDPYLTSVMNDIAFHGLQEVVTIGTEAHGSEEMARIYASHDILIHLSDTGSLDKVVIESLASGCPVFSTNPATVEGVGERWGWSGHLDPSAAKELLTRAEQGVPEEERERIRAQFALTPLIDRIVRALGPASH